MKPNYQPWQVNIDDYWKLRTDRERLKLLLNFAVLAPSSHNSQPWRFEVGNNTISVYLDPGRRLTESDKNDRQAYISLGCAVESILIAADYYGYVVKVNYLPEHRGQFLAATIEFVSSQKVRGEDNHLIFSIPKRTTNRNPYTPELPPDAFLSQAQSFSTPELQVQTIINKSVKDKLADIALQASIAAMENKAFRRELSRYVKPNTTSSPIGMPCFGMGIPTPISFIAPTMIKFLNMNKLSHKKDEWLLKEQTPVLVVIATREDNKLNWLKIGQIYGRIALMAIREGLSTAMWAAPIQIGEYYKEFQKILQTDFRPQAFFRVGYATRETQHSPRLTSSRVS